LVNRSDHPSVFVDRVTLDTVMTCAVAAVLALSVLTRRRITLPLALILAVSTLLAYGGWLMAAVTGSHARLFYIGLIFPVVWSFAFDAEGLNKPGPARGRKVLAATGLAAAGFSLLGVKVSMGEVAPGTSGQAEFGHALFVVPFAVALIATAAIATEPSSGGLLRLGRKTTAKVEP
jgi:hypothetical protein